LSAEIHVSDRDSGQLVRRRVASRAAVLLGVVGIIAGVTAPVATAAGGLSITTPFPAVVAEPGSTASFSLSIDVPSARRVDLRTTGAPSDWTARFRGGSLTIDGAYVDPKSPPSVTLDVEIPDTATPGTTTINVVGSGGGLSDTLPITIRVANAAAGDVTMTSDFPELQGASSATFTFNLSLKNQTAAETTYTINSTGPDGWTVSAKPSGQSQATTITVAAGATGTISVTATPPSTVDAGTYPIKVTVAGGGKTAESDLSVVITGTYALSVSTPDQVLSTTANAGSEKDFQITVDNTGSADITKVNLTASSPTGWDVTFDPATIDTLAAGDTQTVTAKITPSGDALAGDYKMTMTAKGDQATGDVSIRVTVETPQFWWIVGVVLIVATFAGLYWVFRTYGRR
jgi:uncharacterized membrane protein